MRSSLRRSFCPFNNNHVVYEKCRVQPSLSMNSICLFRYYLLKKAPFYLKGSENDGIVSAMCAGTRWMISHLKLSFLFVNGKNDTSELWTVMTAVLHFLQSAPPS